MSSAPGMYQTYPAYTSGAPEDVSTALHGSGEGSLCTKVHAAPASTLYARVRRTGDIAALPSTSCGVCHVPPPGPRDI